MDPASDPRPSYEPQSVSSQPALGTRLFWIAGQASWVAGLSLALSAFMGWYSGSAPEGPTVAILGWNTGTIGKLVFVLGLAIILLAVGRTVGIHLPRALPESILLVGLGTAAVTLVLVRVISIPSEYAGTANRAVGLWVGLASATVVILSGLVRAGEEL